MDPRNELPTWVEVDLQAIETNIRGICGLTRAQVMAVVKADGYGHGSVQVAQAAIRAGASWCGVARLEEAHELRSAGVDVPILLFGPVPAGRLEEAIRASVSLTVFDPDQIAAAAAAGRVAGAPARLHLKVDTGMGRLGSRPAEAATLARRISDEQGAILEGVYTHFARADEGDAYSVDEQLQAFSEAQAAIRADGLVPELFHAANSAATLTRPETHLDMVRIGIALYGLHPSAAVPLPIGFRPALAWKTQLTQVKTLPPGSGVSYGHQYVTRGHERIGTIPVGYADGLRRIEGNRALVNGAQVPVIGRVCMDQCMLQLDATPEARPGDVVTLIGAEGGSARTAEDLAQAWGTINYEVTCGIGRRVPRFYPPR